MNFCTILIIGLQVVVQKKTSRASLTSSTCIPVRSLCRKYANFPNAGLIKSFNSNSSLRPLTFSPSAVLLYHFSTPFHSGSLSLLFFSSPCFPNPCPPFSFAFLLSPPPSLPPPPLLCFGPLLHPGHPVSDLHRGGGFLPQETGPEMEDGVMMGGGVGEGGGGGGRESGRKKQRGSEVKTQNKETERHGGGTIGAGGERVQLGHRLAVNTSSLVTVWERPIRQRHSQKHFPSSTVVGFLIHIFDFHSVRINI